MASARPKRERKEVAKLINEHQTPTKKAAFAPPEGGAGACVADIPAANKFVDKNKSTSVRLQMLHKLFYGQRGLKADIKANCRAFCGLVYDDERAREDVEDKVLADKAWTTANLKTFMDELGVDRSSKTGDVTKEGLVGRLVDWLEKPTANVTTIMKAKANKTIKNKTAKFKRDMALDPNRPKKPQSAYMHFSAAKRAGVWDEMKKAGGANKDVMPRLGEMWKALSAAQRKPYEDLHAADKVRYEAEMAVYVPDPTLGLEKKAAEKERKALKRQKDQAKRARLKERREKQKIKKQKDKEKRARKRDRARKAKEKSSRAKKRRRTSASSSGAKAYTGLFPNSRYMLTKDSESEESESEEKEEEEEEEEEEVALPVPRADVDKALDEILVSADVNALSWKSVRRQLEAKFKVSLKPVKKEIKKMLMAKL